MKLMPDFLYYVCKGKEFWDIAKIFFLTNSGDMADDVAAIKK